MKKILNEWKIFLRENSRFEIDPDVQRHLIKILLGRIDFPQVYNYSDGGVAYSSYVKTVRSSGLVQQKEAENQVLLKVRKKTERKTPERIKIDKQINLLGLQIGNIVGGLSYYWYKNNGEDAASFIIHQKLDLFLAQLSKEQQKDFRKNYADYLGFPDGEIGVSFPTSLPVKTKMISGQQVGDVWIVNAGRPLLMHIVSTWANPGV